MFRSRANDGVFDPSSPHKLKKKKNEKGKRCQSWTTSDKTFWIRAYENVTFIVWLYLNIYIRMMITKFSKELTIKSFITSGNADPRFRDNVPCTIANNIYFRSAPYSHPFLIKWISFLRPLLSWILLKDNLVSGTDPP